MTALTPSADLRRTHFRPEPKLLAGLDAWAHRLRAGWAQRGGRDLRQSALNVLARADRLQTLATAELSGTLAEARRRLRATAEGEPTTTSQAMATLVEVAHRHTGLRAHLEQIMAALALGRGFLLEMNTGEGKTLAIALAAACGAWRAPALHVLTANDYLAARDAAWLRPYYTACGLTVGCVTGALDPAGRTAGYAAAVTYTTPKEAIADFLRDRLLLGPLASGPRRLAHAFTRGAAGLPLVMRGLHRAIIDEADYALIDEAATPLIISREGENAPLVEACRQACALARPLRRGLEYDADERTREIRLHPSAIPALERAAALLPGLWSQAGRRTELLTQALAAREFFHLHRQYLIENGKIVIIDEGTGRVMPQRTWRQGLHQAVEAKEGVPVTAPAETLARLSFQKFYRRYPRLAGITGTGREAAAECWQVYGLPFLRLPTHQPGVREQWPDRVFYTAAAKWTALVQEIRRLHATGRPLLIGSRSVQASRHLAGLLEAQGLAFSLLNAEHPEREAEIIARAGEERRITIATNMAGRGTDIRLGPGVAAAGGLHVLATERHESGRVDRQLFGRAGRQGDPGSAQAFSSLEDDLPRRFAPLWVRLLLQRQAVSGEILIPWLGQQAIQHSQAAAERAARAHRHAVLKADLWLEESLGFAEA